LFDITPITTTNLLTILQILIVLAGFLFSWKALSSTRQSIDIATRSLDTASRNAQAQLYEKIAAQGRELQFKFATEFLADDQNARRDLFIGTMIGYYAATYGQREILELPETVTKLLDEELRQLLSQRPVRDKFEKMKHGLSRKFIEYAESLRGVR